MIPFSLKDYGNSLIFKFNKRNKWQEKQNFQLMG